MSDYGWSPDAWLKMQSKNARDYVAELKAKVISTRNHGMDRIAELNAENKRLRTFIYRVRPEYDPKNKDRHELYEPLDEVLKGVDGGE